MQWRARACLSGSSVGVGIAHCWAAPVLRLTSPSWARRTATGLGEGNFYTLNPDLTSLSGPGSCNDLIYSPETGQCQLVCSGDLLAYCDNVVNASAANCAKQANDYGLSPFQFLGLNPQLVPLYTSNNDRVPLRKLLSSSGAAGCVPLRLGFRVYRKFLSSSGSAGCVPLRLRSQRRFLACEFDWIDRRSLTTSHPDIRRRAGGVACMWHRRTRKSVQLT
jgi:hypothetical protein